MREGGGNCLKYLKKGWNRKEGRGNKDFKRGRGDKLGELMGAIKREGAGTLLRTMVSCIFQSIVVIVKIKILENYL